MADIIVDSEFRRKQKDGSYKIYHPVTKAKNVKTSDGKDVESYLAETTKEIGNINDASLNASLKGKSLTEMAKVLFQNADNGQKSIANVIGNPTIAGDTYSKIANDIQVLKNTLAANLTNKNQPSNGSENLQTLVNKVLKIEEGINVEKYKNIIQHDFTGTPIFIGTSNKQIYFYERTSTSPRTYRIFCKDINLSIIKDIPKPNDIDYSRDFSQPVLVENGYVYYLADSTLNQNYLHKYDLNGNYIRSFNTSNYVSIRTPLVATTYNRLLYEDTKMLDYNGNIISSGIIDERNLHCQAKSFGNVFLVKLDGSYCILENSGESKNITIPLFYLFNNFN